KRNAGKPSAADVSKPRPPRPRARSTTISPRSRSIVWTKRRRPPISRCSISLSSGAARFSEDTMGTVYFTAATFKFQRDLARNNNRAWFAANKERYEDVLKQPFLRFIEDMQKPLAKISAHYRADPRPQGGSLFRIYRDTRFRNDKTPYKTWA